MADDALVAAPTDEGDGGVVDMAALLARWEDEAALEEQLRQLDDPASAGGAAADDRHDWVPLAEAGDRAGVSRSTLRAWYRSGQIPSRLAPGPHGMHRLVPLDLVLRRVARSPRAAAAGATPAHPATSTTSTTPTASTASTASTTSTPSTTSPTAASSTSPAGQEAPPMNPSSDVVRLAELAVHEARERALAAERRAEAAEQALRAAIERAAAAEAELRARRGAGDRPS
jgi:hypothetical protein